MLNKSYQQRLEHDLEGWVKNGWVDRQNTGAILADAARGSSSTKIPAIIGILGAILLAAGVVLFVSANWQEISKLTRLLLLLAAMWFTFVVTVWLKRTSHDYLLEAILFLGAAIFGANIILIAQLYHIDNHYPDGLLFWAVGTLLITLFLRSRATLVLAFCLIVSWASIEILEFAQHPFWPFLPVWLIAAGLAYWLSFRFAIHLAFLSFMAWFFSSIDLLIKWSGFSDSETGGLIVLFLLTSFIYGLVMERKNSPLSLGFGDALAHYAISGLLLIVFFFQVETIEFDGWPATLPFVILAGFAAVLVLGTFIARSQKIFNLTDTALFLGFSTWFILSWFIPALNHLWLQAAIYLGLTIWLLIFGQKQYDKLLVILALIAFGCQVFYLYMETLGTLLDTSVFFLLGGVLLISLALGLEMLRRYLERTRDPQDSRSQEVAS